MNKLQQAKMLVSILRLLKDIPEDQFDKEQYEAIQTAECNMLEHGFKPSYSIHERIENLCNFIDALITKEESD